MYRLADIDFSNVLVISSREPISDEVDRQDETLDENLGSKLRRLARRAREGGLRRCLGPCADIPSRCLSMKLGLSSIAKLPTLTLQRR